MPVSTSFGGGVGADDDNNFVFASAPLIRWAVSADSPTSNNDPALGTIVASAAATVLPTLTVVPESVASGANFSIEPGATASLVYFSTARNIAGSGGGRGTPADALSDITTVILDPAGNVNTAFLTDGLAPIETALNQPFASP